MNSKHWVPAVAEHTAYVDEVWHDTFIAVAPGIDTETTCHTHHRKQWQTSSYSIVLYHTPIKQHMGLQTPSYTSVTQCVFGLCDYSWSLKKSQILPLQKQTDLIWKTC